MATRQEVAHVLFDAVMQPARERSAHTVSWEEMSKIHQDQLLREADHLLVTFPQLGDHQHEFRYVLVEQDGAVFEEGQPFNDASGALAQARSRKVSYDDVSLDLPPLRIVIERHRAASPWEKFEVVHDAGND